MAAEAWIRSNLAIEPDYDAINWGNGVYTPVSSFLTMFGDIISESLASKTDVRQAIRDNDNGRGFASRV